MASAASRGSASATDRDAPVLLGLGANLGDPRTQLGEAASRLREALGPARSSSIYRSAPVGWREQPDFLNLALRFDDPADPRAVLERIRDIERAMGRIRTARDRPRTIDIDILAVGSLIVSDDDLVIPHPRMHQRAFVLLPLKEIAPAWRHPGTGHSPGEMLERAGRLERIERIPAREDL